MGFSKEIIFKHLMIRNIITNVIYLSKKYETEYNIFLLKDDYILKIIEYYPLEESIYILRAKKFNNVSIDNIYYKTSNIFKLNHNILIL